MIKYRCNPLGNIPPNFEPEFIFIATAQPYTQENKNIINGGPSRKLSYNLIFNILNLNLYLPNNEAKVDFTTDQII